MPNGIQNEVWEEHAHNPVNHRSHSCDNPSDTFPQTQLHISISMTYSVKWQTNTYCSVPDILIQCISGWDY